MAYALIIEDDPEIRRMLVGQVRAQGHKFVEASGMEDAQSAINADVFDFFLLDLKIPYTLGDPAHKENGEALLLEIREHPKNRNAGIVVVTSMDDCLVAVDCMQQGADDFIPKPLDSGRKKLRDCISKALANREKRMALEPRAEPRRLSSGTLSFADGKVSLEGIVLCANQATKQARSLKCLASWNDPEIQKPTAKDIADVLGFLEPNEAGAYSVHKAFSDITRKLRRELARVGIELGPDDFISNPRGGTGYSLASGIRIEGLECAAAPARKVARKRKG